MRQRWQLLLILGGQGGSKFGELTPFINQLMSPSAFFIGEDAQLIEQHLRAAKIGADNRITVPNARKSLCYN
jgi:UDP-N-acetylmuramoylalanine--D-glutamate ligase